MKRAFTLIEMLVVIGIIAVLMAASIGGYAHIRKTAENTRARELVSQVKTALEAIWDADGMWPKTIREQSGASDSILNEKVAYVLGSKNVYTVTRKNGVSTGLDRFGILTPWGADTVKRAGQAASLSTTVNGGGSVKDHLLRFKVDLDGDGLIEGASVGGESVNIRAHAAVWCVGREGKMLPYTKGLRGGGVYSWTPGQTVDAK